MIGLDTNVLIRFFVKDDPGQCRIARSLLSSLSVAEPGWIGLATLLELVWVLKSAKGLDRAWIAKLLGELLSLEVILIEHPGTVAMALERYRHGNADFADCLIAASAKAAGCSRTVTFDKIAARDAGMELLA